MSTRYRGSGHPGHPVDRNPGALGRLGASRSESRLDRLRGVLWLAAWEAVRRMPERLAFGIAVIAAPIFRTIARTQRAQLRRNLRRVLPGATEEEIDRLVIDGFRSYARYFIEVFRVSELTPEAVAARSTTEGFEHLDAALERGRGVIVLLAHHGSWDVAARWAESHGYHLAVVAEVVKPRALFARFVTLREQVGLEVVPLRRGDALLRRLGRILDTNHLVGLLSDRDLSGKGPIVELFGEPSRVPPGPVLLARRTGAAVVPITMHQRPGRRWHLQVLPELDVTTGSFEEGCEALAAGIESLVRTDPSQWHALSPVWLADVPAHRRGTVPEDIAERLEGSAHAASA